MTDLLEHDSPPSDRPRIDPRIAQRWIEARRQEGRRRLQAVAVVVAVVCCAGLALGSLYTPLFAVRHVRVTVDGPLSSRTVTAWAGVTGGTHTIDVDARAIAARLDAHPAIGGAHVARHWPGTVTISVTVRSPLAAVAVASGYAQVDATGRVLADVTTPPVGTPVLNGVASVPSPGGWIRGTAGAAVAPGAAASALLDMTAASDAPDVPSGPAAALAFLDALPPLLRSDVTSVTVGGGKGLSLVISPPRMATGTITVLLGDGSQLQAKVAAFVSILDEGDLSGVAGLDLTVPSRPAAASSVAGLSPVPAPVTSGSTPASSTPASPPASSAPAPSAGGPKATSGSAASSGGSAASSGPTPSPPPAAPTKTTPAAAGPSPGGTGTATGANG